MFLLSHVVYLSTLLISICKWFSLCFYFLKIFSLRFLQRSYQIKRMLVESYVVGIQARGLEQCANL